MSTSPTVQTDRGPVVGATTGPVHVFRGIPYARPPVGELRWRPPEEPKPWTRPLEARRFGPIAPQNPSPLEQLFGADRPQQSEDCLSLNVWTPGLDDDRRPVMVWIHGGAFVTGNGATPWYDGTRLVEAGDVVVVTINYRLGALGFLELGELGDERYAGSGNCGILDQVAALRWVRDNIASFGGDPSQVTVFGESAGGMSVGTLLGLPAAQGLFSRAILQSGAASHVAERDKAERVTRDLLAALGLTTDDAARLVDVTVDDLLAAQGRVVDRAGPNLSFTPVVDGVTLPRPPLDAVRDGAAAAIEVLLGTTRDEMQLFGLLDPRLSKADDAKVEHWAASVFGPSATKAIEVYRRSRPDASAPEVWIAVLSDQVFRIPAIRLAEAQSLHQPGTYMYLFSWATPLLDGRLGSCHALDVPFTFDNLDKPGAAMFTGGAGDDRQELAERMSRAWLAFAREGTPAAASLPTWPAYEIGQRSTMVLDTECVVVDDPAAEERRLWDGLA
ncbi:MAG TPA: carboxylesterase/lipase family protein [Acidimicrobiales bacterium]|nr:carboxylesterase/lipase family protein [Acidimicrobiales bacterium]